MNKLINLESVQTFSGIAGPIIIDILNIVISIKLLIEDLYVYPIIFGFFFTLEKLIISMIAMNKRQFNLYMLAISDDKINDFLVFNTSMKFILFFIQLIALYGFQILKDVSETSIINLFFSSYFILGYLLSIIYYFEMSNSILKNLKDFFKYFINYQTYLITISSIITLKGNNQINLGFYTFGILLAQQICIYYYSYQFDSQNIIIENFASIVFSTLDSIKSIKPMGKYLVIINFIGKLLNFIIFLIFFDGIYLEDNSHLTNITNLATVILNIVFLLIFIPQVCYELFQHKVYFLSSVLSIDSYAHDIKHYQSIKGNEVMIYFTNQFNEGIATQTQNEQNNTQCNNKICNWYYQLIEDASNNIYTLPYMQITMHYCPYHFKHVIQNDIQIEHHFLEYCLERIENKELIDSLLERILQGHYNLQIYLRKLNEQQSILFKKMIQSLYQINAFLKLEQNFLTLSPQLVIYDLYCD